MLFFPMLRPCQAFQPVRSGNVLLFADGSVPSLDELLHHNLPFSCPRMPIFSSESAHHRIRAHMSYISSPMVCTSYHGNSPHLPIYDQAHFPKVSQFSYPVIPPNLTDVVLISLPVQLCKPPPAFQAELKRNILFLSMQ